MDQPRSCLCSLQKKDYLKDISFILVIYTYQGNLRFFHFIMTLQKNGQYVPQGKSLVLFYKNILSLIIIQLVFRIKLATLFMSLIPHAFPCSITSWVFFQTCSTYLEFQCDFPNCLHLFCCLCFS